MSVGIRRRSVLLTLRGCEKIAGCTRPLFVRWDCFELCHRFGEDSMELGEGLAYA